MRGIGGCWPQPSSNTTARCSLCLQAGLGEQGLCRRRGEDGGTGSPHSPSLHLAAHFPSAGWGHWGARAVPRVRLAGEEGWL